jgi:hypothetical protein
VGGIDEALGELDPVGDREARARLGALFGQIHATVERLQTRYPRDQILRDTLARLDQLGLPPSTADAKRILERLDEWKSSHPGPTTGAPRGALRRIDPFPATGAKWEDITITFLSDVRVQISIGDTTESRNYAEMGFADRRTSNPNSAWALMRDLAESGSIQRPREFKILLKSRSGRWDSNPRCPA